MAKNILGPGYDRGKLLCNKNNDPLGELHREILKTSKQLLSC